jgi:hypothetical protein
MKRFGGEKQQQQLTYLLDMEPLCTQREKVLAAVFAVYVERFPRLSHVSLVVHKSLPVGEISLAWLAKAAAGISLVVVQFCVACKGVEQAINRT